MSRLALYIAVTAPLAIQLPILSLQKVQPREMETKVLEYGGAVQIAVNVFLDDHVKEFPVLSVQIAFRQTSEWHALIGAVLAVIVGVMTIFLLRKADDGPKD